MFQRVEPDANVKRESEDKVVHVDINIPDILKKKLEDDCFYINKRKKVQTKHANMTFVWMCLPGKFLHGFPDVLLDKKLVLSSVELCF